MDGGVKPNLRALSFISASRIMPRRGKRIGGAAMVITLGPDLESALNDAANKQGIPPQVLVLNTLRERFLAATPLKPLDDWERHLLALAKDCGVSLSDTAVRREAIYD